MTWCEEPELFVARGLVDAAVADVVFELLRSLQCAESPLELLCAPRASQLPEEPSQDNDDLQGLKDNPQLYERLSAFRASILSQSAYHPLRRLAL